MHKASKAEADLSMKCGNAFIFALKAIGTGLGREISTAEKMKIWNVVQAVAAGTQTLNVSPAEQQLKDPSMSPEMRLHIQEMSQREMRSEQEMATMILRAADGFSVQES